MGTTLDFKKVTKIIVSQFDNEGVAYALIGGYAVGLWGVARATVDMDFLVRRDDMAKVDTLMSSIGYAVHFSSENVTQYVSQLPSLGEIDYLHAFREVSLGMLKRAVEKTLFQDGITIKVLIPEDLIGLKVQAFSNNKSREPLDLYDVEGLMKVHGKALDWELIQQYFEIFELMPLFLELRGKYCAP